MVAAGALLITVIFNLMFCTLHPYSFTPAHNSSSKSTCHCNNTVLSVCVMLHLTLIQLENSKVIL